MMINGMSKNVKRTVYEPALGEDISLWNAIARHLEVQGLSINEALRCYAAIAALTESSSSNVTYYTNVLPESILIKIRELYWVEGSALFRYGER